MEVAESEAVTGDITERATRAAEAMAKKLSREMSSSFSDVSARKIYIDSTSSAGGAASARSSASKTLQLVLRLRFGHTYTEGSVAGRHYNPADAEHRKFSCQKACA